MAQEKRNVVKGCIKDTRGPWLVRKTTKAGEIITRLRNPSDRERQNNTARERKRRSITQKIFAGLKDHGNYQLPKNADTNHLLRALCEEAGWHVGEDGTIRKKKFNLELPSLINLESHQYVELEEESNWKCSEKFDCNHVGYFLESKYLFTRGCECHINLCLSL